MKRLPFALSATFLALALLLAQQEVFASTRRASAPDIKVLVIETFLADIVQNVAGNRLKVNAMLPIGADPHGFEPTPADVGKVAECNVLIINGGGFEEFLTELLYNAGGVRKVIEASAGLTARTTREGGQTEAEEDQDGHEAGRNHEDDHGHGDKPQRGDRPVDQGGAGQEPVHVHPGEHSPGGHDHEGHHHESDPHFWLNPRNVVKYVENIRKGLSEADSEGANIYAANADAYVIQLEELDRWISDRMKQIPEETRLLVTNHESFGYFADRYSFRIVGAIVPSVSTGASPSARQMVSLIEEIKKSGAKAIFLETGSDPRLASQISEETGIKVVTELYTHSITGPEGPAPTYIEMMRYNATKIADALE